ncbi:EAL and HDOD domain-containing protein [Marinobacterium sedimentorum]|uniref:EAL and HDOD domain-containing protein n=1 Tax=Marinobacterium sedimentorum TaxID=2927804 RepID=UPI0020C60273|nr:HDOD domain-containing protein [Marinobacterium sedimentorum]
MSAVLKSLNDTDQLPVLLARQPIYTKNQDVVAFELLFRSQTGEVDHSITDDAATLAVITNSYASVCSDGEIRTLPCYLKLTDKVLLNSNFPELPKESFALELLGHTEVTPELLERLKQLARTGYRLVLADYDPSDPKFEPLLSIVHVLKLDILKLGLHDLPEIIRKLKPHNLELLADKVENKEQFRQCLEMGFSLYQGYFLSKPIPVRGKKISGNKVVLLQLLAELQNPDTTAAALEQIAVNDAALTFKILKVVNSAAFSLRREVESLSHAITLLGLDQIRRWVTLFLAGAEPGKPDELTRNMLLRGRMCELLAELMGRPHTMNYFIVGLLSQLDVLLDIEMSELMEQVPLQQDIKAALLTRAGMLGEVLQDVEVYERGEFAALKKLVDPSFYEVSYRHSLLWAQHVMQAMSES